MIQLSLNRGISKYQPTGSASFPTGSKIATGSCYSPIVTSVLGYSLVYNYSLVCKSLHTPFLKISRDLFLRFINLGSELAKRTKTCSIFIAIWISTKTNQSIIRQIIPFHLLICLPKRWAYFCYLILQWTCRIFLSIKAIDWFLN